MHPTLSSDFGYTGLGVEKTLCLDLTWFRVYDPEKGRWLSRDPAGEIRKPNLYAYVDNNTINYNDFMGLMWTATLDLDSCHSKKRIGFPAISVGNFEAA